MPRVYQYECDSCAACCIHLHPQVTTDDRKREPLVELAVRRLYPLGLLRETRTDWFISEDPERGCPLLTDFGSCSVHATKPDVCRRFKPGSELCQWARGKAGLHPLYPIGSKQKW